ncbi:unnamed protein product [Toxocara canis]|uniref:Uncharacterized protein n=1 Tax=Toxocara canis TaxID=6265 RepID=A0A183TZY3_TOXCA|nr:unnamed protein product [Toxocara canis]
MGWDRMGPRLGAVWRGGDAAEDRLAWREMCPMECPCDISTSFDVQNRENQQEWMHEATVAGGEAQGWVSNAMPIAT